MKHVVLAVVLLAAPAQEEIELKWGLAKDAAGDYTVSDVSKGKPVALKDRSFLLFASDLKEDGTNSLVFTSYRDLPWAVVLQLPKGKVKPGAKWNVEQEFFEDARQVMTTMHGFRPLLVRGFFTFKKVEKIGETECARIEGLFELCELKIDTQTNKKTAGKANGRLSTLAYFSLKETVLVRGAFAYASAAAQEFSGIKQGEEPKSVKLSTAEQIDLKKDLIKSDAFVTKEAVLKAIARGVEWMRKQQRKDGSFLDDGGSFARDFPTGTTALCAMALLHSGVKTDDPQVKLVFANLMRAPFKKTYDVAATVMAVETKYLPLENAEDVAKLTEKSARETIQKALTAEDKAFLKKAVDWLLAGQTKDGTWGYPEMAESYDHSNTQYALLALKSAARCGIAIPASVWKKIAAHWLDTQRTVTPKRPLKVTWLSDTEAGIDPLGMTKAEEEYTQGPWGYFVKIPAGADPATVADRGYGSMTCAGLTSLIICESELFHLKELDDKTRTAIDKAKKQGLLWLQEHYTVRSNPPSAGFWSVFHYYFLYSLERVGVLYGIKKLGEHDWYGEGALVLLRDQRDDGGWSSAAELPVVDTAFALLFLKKATLRVDVRTGEKK